MRVGGLVYRCGCCIVGNVHGDVDGVGSVLTLIFLTFSFLLTFFFFFLLLQLIRFMAKRHKRIWTKRVKYDVRKNFADSRLRVKGRFVKKEDEELLRELLNMT